MSTSKMLLIMRHAHRSPLKQLQNKQIWHAPIGSLTQHGISQIQSNACQIATKYSLLFRSIDRMDQIAVRSSHMERTAQSAYYFTNSIMECIKMPQVESIAKFVNHYGLHDTLSNELMFRGYSNIAHPSLLKVYNELNKQHKITFKKEFDTLYQPIKDLYGMSIYEMKSVDIYYLYDYLHVMSEQGIQYSSKEESDVYIRLKECKFYYTLYSEMLRNSTPKRLATHYLFKSIADEIIETKHLLSLYLCHDANLLSLLMALGCDYGEVPECCSYILLLKKHDAVQMQFHSCNGNPINRNFELTKFLSILKHDEFKSIKEIRDLGGNVSIGQI